MRTPFALLALAAVTAAAPSSAGTYFSAVTAGEGLLGGKSVDVTVRGWADGNKARIEFAESRNPILKPGLYLITLDGGTTVYLVDPKQKTFSRWDAGVALGGSAVAAPSARPGADVTFSEPKIEKLGESDGGQIAGVVTRHLRFRTSYVATVNAAGRVETLGTLIEEDLWVAPTLADGALGIWLAKGPAATGDPELDTLLAAQQPKVDGFPLKRVATVTATDKSGKKTIAKLTTTVTELIVGDMPAGSFTMGSGYRETPLAPTPGKASEEPPASADQAAQEQDRYPFDQMIDQPDSAQPTDQPQPGDPTAQPQPGQPGARPQPGQPAVQPTAPVQPQPEPEPEPQDQPEYPFEFMLDSPRL